MRRVTIRDVAAEAGVSIGTASKALNGQGKLRTETRERVAEVAQRERQAGRQVALLPLVQQPGGQAGPDERLMRP